MRFAAPLLPPHPFASKPTSHTCWHFFLVRASSSLQTPALSISPSPSALPLWHSLAPQTLAATAPIGQWML